MHMTRRAIHEGSTVTFFPFTFTFTHPLSPPSTSPPQAMRAVGEWFLGLPAPLAAWLASPPTTTTTTTMHQQQQQEEKQRGKGRGREEPLSSSFSLTFSSSSSSSSSPLARWLAERLMEAAGAKGRRRRGQEEEEEEDEEEEEEGMVAAVERVLDPLFAMCQATPRMEQALALAGEGKGGGGHGWLVVDGVVVGWGGWVGGCRGGRPP
jgi:hypothetical protein